MESKKPHLGTVLSLEVSGKPPRDSRECRQEVDRLTKVVKERRERLNKYREMNKNSHNILETYNFIMKRDKQINYTNWMEWEK